MKDAIETTRFLAEITKTLDFFGIYVTEANFKELNGFFNITITINPEIFLKRKKKITRKT